MQCVFACVSMRRYCCFVTLDIRIASLVCEWGSTLRINPGELLKL